MTRAWLIKLTYPDGQKHHIPILAGDWLAAARLAIAQSQRLPAGIVCRAITWQAERHLRYEDLDTHLKSQAKARFFNAGPHDSYLYHVLRDGSILCRAKAPRHDPA